MRTAGLLLVVACSKHEPPRASPPPVVHDAAVDAVAAAPAVELAKLPICGTTDPVAAICAVGQPIRDAHFECPQHDAVIHDFHRASITWGCDYMGKTFPSVAYQFTVASTAAMPKDGEQLRPAELAWTSRRFPPAGTIEVVEVALRGPNGERRAAELAARTRTWGCVGPVDQLVCGGWSAKIVQFDDAVWLKAGHLDALRD